MNDKTAKYVFCMKDGSLVVYEGMLPRPLLEKDRGTITITRKDMKKFVIVNVNEVSWYTWEYEEEKET